MENRLTHWKWRVPRRRMIHFFVGSIGAVVPVLATSLNGRGAENIGLIQTCIGLGTVLAALFISLRNIKTREALILFGSVFFIGLSLLLISGMHLSGIRIVIPFLFVFLAIGGLIIFAGTSFRSMI